MTTSINARHPHMHDVWTRNESARFQPYAYDARPARQLVNDTMREQSPWGTTARQCASKCASAGGLQTSNSGAMTDDQAKAIVARHFKDIGGTDQLINLQDLKNIANGVFTDDVKNTNYPAELQAAAAHIVKNPQIFTAMDTANGRNAGGWGQNADGLVNAADMAAVLPETKMSRQDVRALDILARNADKLNLKSNGCFDTSELNRLAQDPSQSAELRAACEYIAGRKDLFMRMDTYAGLNAGRGGANGGDGEVSMEDFKKLLANTKEFHDFNNARNGTSQQSYVPPRNVGNAYGNDYGNSYSPARDSGYRRDFDRSHVGHSSNQNYGYQQSVNPWTDMARGTGATNWQNRSAGMNTPREALSTLADYFKSINNGNHITVNDLKRIAEGQLTGAAVNTNYPPELRAAAQYFVDHPELLEQVDTADGRSLGVVGGVSNADGVISQGDMAAALSQAGMTRSDMRVVDALMDNANLLPRTLDQDTLAQMVNDPTLPPRLRDALAQIQHDPSLLMRLDTERGLRNGEGGQGGGDGTFSIDDLIKLAERPEYRAMQSRMSEMAQGA